MVTYSLIDRNTRGCKWRETKFFSSWMTGSLSFSFGQGFKGPVPDSIKPFRKNPSATKELRELESKTS